MSWLEVGGWIGSILVVVSLTQARVLRFRWLNLVGSVIATAYNAIIGIWPFVAMNAAIAVINVYWLTRLYRERHSTAAYEAVAVAPDDAYLRHLLRVNGEDMTRVWPGFSPSLIDAQSLVHLVVRGDETVGVVCLRPTDEPGEAMVVLDWVNVKFRDFTPGEFVYRQSSVFAEHGLTHLRVLDPPDREHNYLRRMGFEQTKQGWTRNVT